MTAIVVRLTTCRNLLGEYLMKIRIKSAGKLSNTTFHRRCGGRQKFWWLRQVDGGFIEVPEVRGDYYFDLELDLEEGSYTLGVGPSGQHGIREPKEVSAEELEKLAYIEQLKANKSTH